MTSSDIITPDRSHAPAFNPVTHLDIQKADHWKLSNGIPVHFINAGFQDLVRVEFLFLNRKYSFSSPQLTFAVNRQITEGTSRHSALEIAEMV
ncbi:MAG: insulinase family protein, partial [Bacteroidota bacterium]